MAHWTQSTTRHWLYHDRGRSTIKCPSFGGMHTETYVASSWNLSFVPCTAKDTTRNHGTQRAPLNVPMSVCGNWSLENHNLPVLQQHPTMMRTSQALPHAKQHVRQHYTSPWNIPTCRKSTGWFFCCTHAASKRLQHLGYIIRVCGSANHLCDPLQRAILQFHTQVTNSRTRSVRWRKAYGIASSLQQASRRTCVFTPCADYIRDYT